jgi:hypothetical protein
MVPMGDEVDRGLERWRGEMDADLREVKNRFGRIESAIADQRTDMLQAIEDVRKDLGKLDEKFDGLNDKVTVLTTKASVYAVMGGLVSSIVLSFVAAFGNKLIGGG